MEILLLWLLFAVFSASLAQAKKRSGVIWFFIGALFGPFGLLVAFYPKQDSPQPPGRKTQQYKKCTFCAEEILDEATVCKHCGRDVSIVGSEHVPDQAVYDEFTFTANRTNLPTIVAVMGLGGFIIFGVYILTVEGNPFLGSSYRDDAVSPAASATAKRTSAPSFRPVRQAEPSWTDWEISNALYRSKSWLLVKQGPQDCYMLQRYKSDPDLLNLHIMGSDRRPFVSHAWQGTRRVTFWVDSSKKQSFQRKAGSNPIHLPENLIPNLKSGRVLYVNFFIQEGHELTQAFDLSGFSNAYNGLNSADCKSQPVEQSSAESSIAVLPIQPSSAAMPVEPPSAVIEGQLVPRRSAEDKSKYYLLSAYPFGRYLEVVHKRVGPNSIEYSLSRIDCKSSRYIDAAQSESSVSELTKSVNAQWTPLIAGSSKSDLAEFVCSSTDMDSDRLD